MQLTTHKLTFELLPDDIVVCNGIRYETGTFEEKIAQMRLDNLEPGAAVKMLDDYDLNYLGVLKDTVGIVQSLGDIVTVKFSAGGIKAVLGVSKDKLACV